jgi:histidine triad (HIT) family protein
MTCVFCENLDIKKRTIVENDTCLAFPTNIPIVPGHVLVIPKRHVQYYEDLTVQEKADLEQLRYRLNKALKKVFSAQGFNYAWNEEKVGGQSVPHFHLHIVPRTEGDIGIYEYEPRKFLYRPGSRAESPEKELDEVVNLIKNNT